ncbi:MAG: DUF547 domain-containing protein [Sedimentisphaerales bacterium]
MTGILTVTLLVSWGCEQKSTNAAAPSNPPAAAVTPQPATAPAKAIEPNKVEVKPEPVKIEQAVQQEPNTPAAPVAEPTVQAIKPVEPNTQRAVTPKPAKAETDSAKSQSTPPATSNTATHLFDQVTAFLKKYVNKDGLVDYKALSHKKMETVKLLEQFRKLDRNEYNSWSKDDKLAFWINGYNLNFIKIIVDNYPIESNRMLRLFWPPNSIRHINGIWNEHKFIIMNEEFTLQEIDQRFLQKEFGEPLAFFAISYASVSGPPLRNEAYHGQNLSTQFDDQVKKFLAGQHAFKIDRENKKVYLSSILSPTWYGNQFVAKYGTDLKFKQQEPAVRAILNFLTKYVSPQDVDYLETGNYTVEFLRYDWTLNDRAGQ